MTTGFAVSFFSVQFYEPIAIGCNKRVQAVDMASKSCLNVNLLQVTVMSPHSAFQYAVVKKKSQFKKNSSQIN